jgi:hypothetical protein
MKALGTGIAQSVQQRATMKSKHPALMKECGVEEASFAHNNNIINIMYTYSTVPVPVPVGNANRLRALPNEGALIRCGCCCRQDSVERWGRCQPLAEC